MIDNFAILFSTLMILFTAFRALRLDRERPWFEIKPPETPKIANGPGKANGPSKTGQDDDTPVWRRRR